MSVYNQQVTIRQQHQQRLTELLDAVKQEFDFTLNEASNFKQVKDDYDLKYNQQINEMQQIRTTVYELEMAHRKIKEAYEEEILRLKTELENRSKSIPQPGHGGSHGSGSNASNQPPPLGQPSGQPPTTTTNNNALSGQTPQIQPPTIQQPNLQNIPPPQINQPPIQVIPGGQGPIGQGVSIPPISQLNGSSNNNVQPLANPIDNASVNNTNATNNSQLQIIDSSQYVVNPAQKSLHIKEIPPFLADLDIAKAHNDFKKQLPDYYVLYNPAFAKKLDVELIHSLNHSSVVCCVRFSKNGEFIATGCNKTTQVFNVKTGELVAKLIDDNNSNGINDDSNKDKDTNSNGDLYIRSACFSPDGKFLATGAEDKLIRIWDLTTKRIIKILRGHEQDIYSLDFFPDGNRLVSGSGDRTVRIWDLRSSQCSLTLSIEDGVTTVAVSPDGQLIAAGSLDRTVRVWDANTGFLVERLDSGNEQGNGHEDSVYSVAFSTNGKQIASGSLDRTVKLWNLRDKQESTIGAKKSSCDVTYIGHKDFVLSVCSTPNNDYILSGSKDRGVIFWDRESGNPLLMLQGHRNSVISVAVSLESGETEGVFATGSGDCKARLWKWTLKK